MVEQRREQITREIKGRKPSAIRVRRLLFHVIFFQLCVYVCVWVFSALQKKSLWDMKPVHTYTNNTRHTSFTNWIVSVLSDDWKCTLNTIRGTCREVVKCATFERMFIHVLLFFVCGFCSNLWLFFSSSFAFLYVFFLFFDYSLIYFVLFVSAFYSHICWLYTIPLYCRNEFIYSEQ